MKIQARQVTLLVALGLALLAAGSAIAYWRLKPPPAPAQVIYGSGRIEADEVRVGLELGGRLVENRAVEGATLELGAPLARIEPADVALQSERAAAQQAAAAETEAQIVSQIGLAQHHTMTARADLDRYESLARDGYAPAQRLDVVRNAYQAAADQVAVLKARRAEAAAQARAAGKVLELSRSQLAKTSVAAPITGAVLQRLAEPGEVVAAGQPVAVLADLTRVKLRVFVGERDLGKVRLGAPARIRVDAFPGRDFTARVARVDAQAQFTPRDIHMQDERSRTVYGVTLEAPNPQGVLKPGMPADAWILWDARVGWPARLAAPQ
ncbi:HlyD family secretion protein [Phenylobacterium aquaticum]|uniref:HlyD family secretion protein n=1 Tax=Phenylobacterium aquaticum TaxID=1763816 RepID=UPI001F5C656A|nr:efflux RND transporter periplasmic adaptor subunit [Phenylobacterium aquaticum]